LKNFRIEKLARIHEVENFDCGQAELNKFLYINAFNNQLAGSSQTYLALSDSKVIGFYSLVVGQVLYSDAPERLKKGLPRHPIPIMLLARMAVDKNWQGQGIGAGLLKDAMLRTLQASDIAGIRAFIVHAKNQNAKAFYEHFNFQPSPTDPYHLFLLLKDIKASLE
jgi:GNAT superfamily N-acetyltransferase